MEKVRYDTPIDDYLYKEFNRDRSIGSFFKPQLVGRCMELIDDYFLSVDGNVTKKGWEEYYLARVELQNLTNASNFIKEKYKIDLDTATEYVFYRVIGQTWNGMMSEINCIDNLKDYFPNINFEKAPFELDKDYCVDWQGFSNGKLLFGIQIKPESYQYMSSPYQLKAKELNQKQVQAYKERFGVAHFFVYHHKGKFIHSQPLIDKINTYLLMNIRVNL